MLILDLKPFRSQVKEKAENSRAQLCSGIITEKPYKSIRITRRPPLRIRKWHHLHICQSHNQLIVWFASAAHSNLDSKNLTFLGLKNDVQITAVMNNFLLKPRSRNLFKCFFFILRHIQRIHRKHFQNFQMFILQYNSQFPDPPKVFLELAKETWKIHHTTTDTTNPMLDLEQYNQIRSHNGTLL